MTRPDPRRDRVFYVMAGLLAVAAASQAVGAVLAASAIGLAVAVMSGCVAGYVALHPRLRNGWYELGYEAATPTLPAVLPGDGGGYAIFASEAVDGDPQHQALMVAARGITTRPLLDEHDRYTADWIVTIPLPQGAHVERAEVVVIPP